MFVYDICVLCVLTCLNCTQPAEEGAPAAVHNPFTRKSETVLVATSLGGLLFKSPNQRKVAATKIMAYVF